MKNYNFETRPMTLEEKKILGGVLKSHFKIQRIALIITFILPFIVFEWQSLTSSLSIIEGFLVSSASALMVLLLFGSIIWLYFFFIKKKVKKDIDLGDIYTASAKLNDFINSDSENDLGFHFVFNKKLEYLHFYCAYNTMIKTKSMNNAISFAEIEKEELGKALQKNQIYKLTFALNTEYLFSMEEI
jgi:hypothetical protein